MKKKYDLYQSQNLRYELPVFNKNEHPNIKWKTKMMRKFTYPGKHIAVKIVVATHIHKTIINQLVQETWKTIYNNPGFRSNVHRGVHWQRILQWQLLELSVDTEENKDEIMDDYINEFINSDDEYQQQIMESYEKEAQEQFQIQQQEAVKFIQQAIKIKLEPNTTSTSTTSNNDDEDSITTITID
jgi:hypothetical protein